MDIDTLHTRRRTHLQRLIRERFGGNKSAFARAVERYPAEISRWLKRAQGNTRWARNMSESSARSIEHHLGLAMGFLDQPVNERANAVYAPHCAHHPAPCIQEDAAAVPPEQSLLPPFCCHGVAETQCRHCALVSEIAHTLKHLSYLQVKTISKLIDVLRSQD